MKINRHLLGLPFLGAGIGTQIGTYIGNISGDFWSYTSTGLTTGAIGGLLLALLLVPIDTSEMEKKFKKLIAGFSNFQFKNLIVKLKA